MKTIIAKTQCFKLETNKKHTIDTAVATCYLYPVQTTSRYINMAV